MLCLSWIAKKYALMVLALLCLVSFPQLAFAQSATIKFSGTVAKQCSIVIDDKEDNVSIESDQELLGRRNINPTLKCNFPTQNDQPVQSIDRPVSTSANVSSVIVNSIVPR